MSSLDQAPPYAPVLSKALREFFAIVNDRPVGPDFTTERTILHIEPASPHTVERALQQQALIDDIRFEQAPWKLLTVWADCQAQCAAEIRDCSSVTTAFDALGSRPDSGNSLDA